MDLTVQTADLLSACTRCSHAVKTVSTLPIIGNFMLLATDGFLTITGSIIDQSISVEIPAEVREDGGFTVPAIHLSSIAKDCAAESIRIRIEGDEITVKEKRTHKFKGLPPDQFPPLILDSNPNQAWEFEASALYDCLRKVANCQSTDTAKYNLCGMLVHETKTGIQFVAANGYVMAIVNAGASSGEARFIVPAIFTKQCMRVLAEASGIATLRLYDHAVSMDIDTTLISSKLVEAMYPRYEAGIPTEFTHWAELDRKEFIKEVRALAVGNFTDEHRCQVLMDFSEEELSIKVDTDHGVSTGSIPCKSSGNCKIKIDKRYLEATLSPLGSDSVRFEWQDRGWLAVRSEKYLGLIAPVRI